MAIVSQARCGSCRLATNGLSTSTAGTLLTRFESTAVTAVRAAELSRCTNRGIEIGFWTYFKVGAPLTLETLLIGLAWL